MPDSLTPWTVTHLAPLSMGFSRQKKKKRKKNFFQTKNLVVAISVLEPQGGSLEVREQNQRKAVPLVSDG